jgi:hypothetical protein
MQHSLGPRRFLEQLGISLVAGSDPNTSCFQRASTSTAFRGLDLELQQFEARDYHAAN